MNQIPQKTFPTRNRTRQPDVPLREEEDDDSEDAISDGQEAVMPD